MILSSLVLLLPSAASPAPPGFQTPPASPATEGQEAAAQPTDAPTWQRLNGVALIVNEECLTTLDIERQARFLAAQSDAPADNPWQRFVEIAVKRSARSMLEEQGGQDLGFDPEQVERLVAEQLDRERESLGSDARLAEKLARQEKDSFTRREEMRTYIYGKIGREAAIGKGPSPGGRLSVDGYVRPGLLFFAYRDRLGRLRSVKITQLIINIERNGGPEAARALAEDLRARVNAGEDMGELAELHGVTPPGTRGQSDFLQLAALQRSFPLIHDFLVEARLGELSPVLPYVDRAGREGLIVVRADEWTEVADFLEREPQSRLASEIRGALEQQHEAAWLEVLLGGAYVWPPGALGEER